MGFQLRLDTLSAGRLVSFSNVAIIFFLFCLVRLVQSLLKRTSLPPLPPGPPRIPLIGNVFNMPKEKAWETFANWRSSYGDVVSLNGLGQHVIILNSYEAVHSLLDKKGTLYAHRPEFRMLLLGGLGNLILAMSNTPAFRYRRKLIHQSFGTPSATTAYYSGIEAEVRRLIKGLFEAPSEFKDHIEHASSGIILRAAYGFVNVPQSLTSEIEAGMGMLSEAAIPTAYLINFIPWMRHLPSWLPGTGFRRLANNMNKTLVGVSDTAFNMVKQNMTQGSVEASYTSRLIEKGEDDEIVKWTAIQLYGGIAGTVIGFFKAMTLYQDAQARAQQEIDTVIGNDRLPSFSDRGELPYCEALILEVFRWHCVAPNGVPHRLLEDDIYQGMRIPAGSFVIPNAWGISKDPSLYKDPDKFEPLRFLSDGGFSEQAPEQDPRAYVFGHGRRVCAGQALAEASMFLEMVTVLSLFNISRYVDAEGVIDEPSTEMLPGLISFPCPFNCSIKPRNAAAEALLRANIME
ncbi:cytochrome P450 [Fistulina hepatica ATCC 64428]|uniref:Cytochrome P450 n=1 Tax=Fistulina hepatica ATCC 64428 TaxID=1128425 RepID=A0A0D7A9U7_9AGAR|nr:cytochrome P450 [Fistulina hepatica ATCC 64428]